MIQSEAKIGVCGTQYVPSRLCVFWTRKRRSGTRRRIAMAPTPTSSVTADNAVRMNRL